MAYRGSVWRDLAAATPVSVGLGVAGDFAETQVNPSFVGAKVAPIGWGVAALEALLGLGGAALSATTGDEMWYEVAGEPLWVLGAADLGKNATHYVRNRLNAKKTTPAQPAAPTQVYRAQAQQAQAVPMRPRYRGYTGGLYPSAAV